MVKRRELPSAERLNELFLYEPETGVLRAKVTLANNRTMYRVGDEVGYSNGNGYLVVTVDKQLCFVHRVIWKLVTGKEPAAYLDHANRIKDDNRWTNLREATARQNAANTGLRRMNQWGATGVTPLKTGWAAHITGDGGAHEFLGVFPTVDRAAQAYERRHKELHGEFAVNAPRAYDVVLLADEALLEDLADIRRELGRLQRAAHAAGQSKFEAALDGLSVSLAGILKRANPGAYSHYRT